MQAGIEETFNFSEKVNPFQTATDKYEVFQEELNSITHAITFLFCSCAVVADVIMIVSILKLEKLRYRINYYIMHFAIFNCLYFLVTPPFFIVFERTTFSSYYNSKFLCALLQTERTCLSFCFLFTCGLCFQWLESSFKSELGHKFSKVLRYLPYVLYVIGLSKFFATFGLCFTEYSDISLKIHETLYFLTFAFCIILNVVELKYGFRHKEYFPALLSNIIVFCWFPFYVYKYLYKTSVMISDDNPFKWPLEFAKFVFEWPAYASTIAIFIVFSAETNLFHKIYYSNRRRTLRSYKITTVLEEGEDGDINEEEVNIKANQNFIDVYV